MLISYSARQIWPIYDRGSPLGLSSALAESDSGGCVKHFSWPIIVIDDRFNVLLNELI